MFTPLANLVDLHDGFRKTFMLRGASYLLLQTEQQLYLVENRCPHLDAPLANADVKGSQLRCRAHGIAFSLVTGRAEGPLAASLDCLKFLELVYHGDQVGVEI